MDIDTATKLLDRAALVDRFSRERRGSATVVFTNGCFDLLHPGHIDYLEKARALGDFLVIGLNSDASAARLKRPRHPVVRESDRARVLGALACVDAITLFHEDTPLELISSVLPDVLVKGGDYTLNQIVGRGIVEAAGGVVEVLPFLSGYSTTELRQRILESSGEKP